MPNVGNKGRSIALHSPIVLEIFRTVVSVQTRRSSKKSPIVAEKLMTIQKAMYGSADRKPLCRRETGHAGSRTSVHATLEFLCFRSMAQTHGLHSKAQHLLEISGEVGEEDVDPEVSTAIGHRDRPHSRTSEDREPRRL